MTQAPHASSRLEQVPPSDECIQSCHFLGSPTAQHAPPPPQLCDLPLHPAEHQPEPSAPLDAPQLPPPWSSLHQLLAPLQPPSPYSLALPLLPLSALFPPSSVHLPLLYVPLPHSSVNLRLVLEPPQLPCLPLHVLSSSPQLLSASPLLLSVPLPHSSWTPQLPCVPLQIPTQPPPFYPPKLLLDGLLQFSLPQFSSLNPPSPPGSYFPRNAWLTAFQLSVSLPSPRTSNSPQSTY
mmetsp:Transcript_39812/g.55287  ORF Transcript_39812/g.55287 Transcript_39812/m.55287 type:complete len:236 (-) Transcript_39812:401-1108(-)